MGHVNLVNPSNQAAVEGVRERDDVCDPVTSLLSGWMPWSECQTQAVTVSVGVKSHEPLT